MAVQGCEESLALVAVLGGRRKKHQHQPWGQCVWAVQECEPLALVAGWGKKEKVAPALADGGSACGRCRGAKHHLPWWQCWRDGEGSTSTSQGGSA